MPGSSFNHTVTDVRRNRLWVNQRAVEVDIASPRRRRRRPWRIDESIWAPRKFKGNSRDYYETDASMRTVFDSDWEFASAGLAKTVIKADADGKFVDLDEMILEEFAKEAEIALFTSAFHIVG